MVHQQVRPVAPMQAGMTMPGAVSPGRAEADVAAYLARRETALATVALLPLLDRAGQDGHGPSRMAAALLRSIALPAEAPAPSAMPDDPMAQAVQRLVRLLREQDAQVERLQAMLEAVL